MMFLTNGRSTRQDRSSVINNSRKKGLIARGADSRNTMNKARKRPSRNSSCRLFAVGSRMPLFTTNPVVDILQQVGSESTFSRAASNTDAMSPGPTVETSPSLTLQGAREDQSKRVKEREMYPLLQRKGAPFCEQASYGDWLNCAVRIRMGISYIWIMRGGRHFQQNG